jgi:excisionase family DNA binding protein
MEDLLTFEKLPEAVAILTKEVIEFKRLFIENQERRPHNAIEELLSIDEAAEFLMLAKPTLYSKVSKNAIPFMKRGKRLYFSRTELMEYLKKGRKKSTDEIEQEAEAHLRKLKKTNRL